MNIKGTDGVLFLKAEKAPRIECFCEAIRVKERQLGLLWSMKGLQAGI